MVIKGIGWHQGRNTLRESSKPKTTDFVALQRCERDGCAGRDGLSKLVETLLEKHLS